VDRKGVDQGRDHVDRRQKKVNPGQKGVNQEENPHPPRLFLERGG